MYWSSKPMGPPCGGSSPRMGSTQISIRSQVLWGGGETGMRKASAQIKDVADWLLRGAGLEGRLDVARPRMVQARRRREAQRLPMGGCRRQGRRTQVLRKKVPVRSRTRCAQSHADW